ncbi:MAG TPA: segregation/condensation protein A [Anaeromyxobacteraceae bacterium]|nr:segregation/condensation protein A [Anaeromyxobacteraceae bacterium]
MRRLLEYQKYKAAGEELGGRDILDRTVFARRARAERPAPPDGPEGLADVSVFKLIEALDRALAHARPDTAHEVHTDRLTISDAIARITESYLATLEALRELDIDVAGEFLHMAAQLVLMKSRLLLPRTEVGQDAGPEEGGGDPRADLVRRLLEYQKYKAAGEELGRHDILERDVFGRRHRAGPLPQPEGPDGLAEVSVFKLIEALDRALRAARPEVGHEVVADRLSVADAISRVAEALRLRRRVSFAEILAGSGRHGRAGIIATFLAVLEMARLRLLRLFQARGQDGAAGEEIAVEPTETLGEGSPGTEVDDR